MGTGDYNGDGRSDILWRNDNGEIGVWNATTTGSFAYDPTTASARGTDWKVVGNGDFNGNGIADILWRNDNGTLNEWLTRSSGFAPAGPSYAVGNDWQVVG